MVYACAYCEASLRGPLAKRAFADSKTLTEEKREALYEEILADSGLGWAVESISARELSAKMLQRQAGDVAWWLAASCYC